MDQDLKIQLEEILGSPILKGLPLSGGDISAAYLLYTQAGRFFCKINHGKTAYDMFLAERAGLDAISGTSAIKAPEVVDCSLMKTGACLIMDYIEAKRPSDKNWEALGFGLANLHQCSSVNFGFGRDNYIGSLPQSNFEHSSWDSFYLKERLLPQLHLAKKKNLLSENDIPSVNVLEDALIKFFSKTKPSLLHGDLWSGNYLISSSGTPYLIDPAVYFGHSEVDLAMSNLFGGFGTNFYNAYQEILPKSPGYAERQDLYQLYYLLVHLNLFGMSYFLQVSNILKRYFA